MTITFANALQQARLDAGLSQHQLSIDSGYNHSFISRLETDSRKPSQQTVLVLANALGCNVYETDALLISAGFAPESDHMRMVIANAMQTERLRMIKRMEWAAHD